MVIERESKKGRAPLPGDPPTKPLPGPTLIQDARGDSVTRMLLDIKEGRVDPKVLDSDTRRSLLLFMANGKRTAFDLSKFFGVTVNTIRKDMRLLREEVGAQVRTITPEDALGQLALTAERCMVAAEKQNDYPTVWSIQRDYIRTLKDLGLLGQADRESSFKVTIEGIGEGYGRAREILSRGLAPHLTGEVLKDATVKGKDRTLAPLPALPFKRRSPTPPQESPGLELRVEGFAVPQNEESEAETEEGDGEEDDED